MLRPIQTRVKRFLRRRRSPDVIQRVNEEHLSYLEHEALLDLYDVVNRVEKKNAPGIIVEAGCALGGSAIVMAAAKATTRPLRVIDVFGMIPPPFENDGEDVHARYELIANGKSKGIEEQPYYGYQSDLRNRVIDNFQRLGMPVEQKTVQLVEGLFQDSLFLSSPVAAAHIDGDRYESVRVCLERIVPHLSPECTLVVDDYSTWSGCRRAVDEFFHGKESEHRFVKKSRLHIQYLPSGTSNSHRN